MTTERTKKFSKRAQEKSSLTASLTKGVLKVLQLCRPSKRRSADQLRGGWRRKIVSSLDSALAALVGGVVYDF